MKNGFTSRLGWMVSGVVVGLGISFALGAVRSPEASDRGIDNYEALKPFSEAYAYIQNAYVDSAKAKPQDLVRGAIRGMVETLDPFSAYMAGEDLRAFSDETHGTYEGIGIETGVKDRRMVVISPIDDTPAQKAGLKAGDWIVKINNESTERFTFPQVIRKIRGEHGTKVTLAIWRDGFQEPRDFTIARGDIKLVTVRSALLDGGVGYVRLSEFMGKTADDMGRALSALASQGMKAVILDVRNNPGGLLGVSADVARYFLEGEKMIVYRTDRNDKVVEQFTADKKAPYAALPLAVLINGGSASASEIVAGAIKDWNRGVLIGTRSFGKGTVQTQFPLSDRSALHLTVGRYHTPKGQVIHGVGIQPDVVAEMPNLSSSTAKLLDGDWFGKFAKSYVALHPQGLPKADAATSADRTAREAEQRLVEDELIRDLARTVRDGGGEVSEEGLRGDRRFVLDQIRVEVARVLQGEKEAYREVVMSDPQVERALEVLKVEPIFKTQT